MELQETNPNNKIMCLNFAYAKNPGGGFINGAEPQEESIARSSGLYSSQMSKFGYYEAHRKMTSCVYTEDMIYSTGVPVFRNDPKTIGNLFKELLLGKYKNVFKNVHFAVLTKNETILEYFKIK